MLKGLTQSAAAPCILRAGNARDSTSGIRNRERGGGRGSHRRIGRRRRYDQSRGSAIDARIFGGGEAGGAVKRHARTVRSLESVVARSDRAISESSGNRLAGLHAGTVRDRAGWPVGVPGATRQKYRAQRQQEKSSPQATEGEHQWARHGCLPPCAMPGPVSTPVQTASAALQVLPVRQELPVFLQDRVERGHGPRRLPLEGRALRGLENDLERQRIQFRRIGEHPLVALGNQSAARGKSVDDLTRRQREKLRRRRASAGLARASVSVAPRT